MYFALNGERALANIISDIKKDILHGIVILFSGVLPKSNGNNKHEMVQQAESLGAVCVNDFDSDFAVTHVIGHAHKGIFYIHMFISMFACMYMCAYISAK